MKKQRLKKLPNKKDKPRKFKISTIKKKEKVQEQTKKAKVHKFKLPSFYRSFPVEKLRKIFSVKRTIFYVVLLFLFYVLLIIAITSISVDIYRNIRIEQEVYAKRNEVYHQKNYWEKVVQIHSGYRDGYYNLAVLELKLGNKEKAKEYLSKVFKIDPNFEKGRELEKMIGK